MRNLRSLGDVQDKVDRESSRSQIKNDKELNKGIHLQDRKAAFEMITETKIRNDHCWAQRWGRVDHAIAVDTEKNIITDSEEMAALNLSTHVLRMCGGGEAPKLRVKEAKVLQKW